MDRAFTLSPFTRQHRQRLPIPPKPNHFLRELDALMCVYMRLHFLRVFLIS